MRVRVGYGSRRGPPMHKQMGHGAHTREYRPGFLPQIRYRAQIPETGWAARYLVSVEELATFDTVRPI